jgi:hypothetical protein
MDDISLSVEEELDPNWGLSREYLLSVLPEPNEALLDEMAVRYPAQFETMPVQVRSPHCWRFYVKFFSFLVCPLRKEKCITRLSVTLLEGGVKNEDFAAFCFCCMSFCLFSFKFNFSVSAFFCLFRRSLSVAPVI